MKEKAVNLDFLTLDMIKIETRDEITEVKELQPKIWNKFGENSGEETRSSRLELQQCQRVSKFRV